MEDILLQFNFVHRGPQNKMQKMCNFTFTKVKMSKYLLYDMNFIHISSLSLYCCDFFTDPLNIKISNYFNLFCNKIFEKIYFFREEYLSQKDHTFKAKVN